VMKFSFVCPVIPMVLIFSSVFAITSCEASSRHCWYLVQLTKRCRGDSVALQPKRHLSSSNLFLFRKMSAVASWPDLAYSCTAAEWADTALV